MSVRFPYHATGLNAGEVAKTLLTYTADVAVRGHPPLGSMEDDTLGSTVTDLAAEDRALLLLLRARQQSHTAHCDIEEWGRPIKPVYRYHEKCFLSREVRTTDTLGEQIANDSGRVVTIGLIAIDLSSELAAAMIISRLRQSAKESMCKRASGTSVVSS